MKLTLAVPYISILLANLIYLYSRGLQQQLQWFQVFLYNFIIMVFVGIFVTIHLNVLLHRWLVQEVDRDQGKASKKEVIKRKVGEFLDVKRFVGDLFNDGNQTFLVKVYFGIVLFKWVISFIPGIFAGLLLGLYYQFKKPIQQRLKPVTTRLNKLWDKSINHVLLNLPRHKSIQAPRSQFVDYATLKQKQEDAQTQSAEPAKNQ